MQNKNKLENIKPILFLVLVLSYFYFPIHAQKPTSPNNPKINTISGSKTKTETLLEKAGFVDIQTLDSTIKVSLMYARADNFTGKILYQDLTRAYLHPRAA